jgi:hypothetical protein
MRRPTDQLGAAVAYARLGHRVLPLHHPIPASTTVGVDALLLRRPDLRGSR